MENIEKLIFEFKNPSNKFTPIPFWFWNDDLSEEEIKRQIGEFNSKGVNGFIIHPRIGLPESIEYMSEEWLGFVKFAVLEAKKYSMKVMLYDEAMYPSGSCHGEVIKTNPDFASKRLVMKEENTCLEDEKFVAEISKNNKKYYFFEAFSKGTIRGIHFGEDDGEPNAPPSANLLDPDAVSCFINLTHQRYFDFLKEEFGKTIIAIFTDEPMICGRVPYNCVPWTSGLEKTLNQKGFNTDDLYYLFEKDDSEKSKKANDIFENVVRERLEEAYYNQISVWCKNHYIAFIGHPEKSTDISVLKYFDIPCQDIVWRYVAPGEDTAINGPHSTMAKCASDSARHRGKRRNGNECFGCCGHTDDKYAFTRNDMKWYIDWLFVRGCNLIIPHAFFYSIRGARKDERPPDVGLNNSFWREYKEISDYIKRCSAMNTDSKNVTDIAVLCGADNLPWNAAKELFESQIEFNYLEYDLLSECEISNAKCKLKNNEYKILVIDGIYPDEKVNKYLQEFKASGGIVIDYSNQSEFIDEIREYSSTILNISPVNNLRITHINKYGVDILFCVNEGEAEIEASINEKILYVLDAESGEVLNCECGKYKLSLLPRKSLYLILDSKN
ncbi:MAG: hypothetical protein IKT38_00290 [Clostridia bacterium]|nr:hypothetical protein [Clostridia bacterium]